MTPAALVEKLKEASVAYYNTGDAIMTDAEYDILVDQLRTADPDNEFLKTVGAPPIVASGELVKHPVPMGSQEKLKNKKEFTDWIEKMMTAGAKAFVIDEKLDGITLACYYENGKLTNAVTRGDGFYGEDITANILKSKGVRKQLPDRFTGVLRAELMLRIPLFEKHFKPVGYKNPRNTVSGMSRDKKGNDLCKYFEPFFFSRIVFDEENAVAFLDEDKNIMESWGLTCAKSESFSKDDDQQTEVFIDELWAAYERAAAGRSALDHEIDGVIVKVADNALNKKLGMSSDLRPKGERCVKFEAMGGITKLIAVELTLGHTGAIIPTAKLEPLGIGGVTVTSALLNNYEEIERLDVAINDMVKVIRAGDVIPKIIGVAEKAKNRIPIVPPKNCIACLGPLMKDGAHIFCKNEECEGRAMQRLKSWITKRDIKFIGDTLLEELYTRQGVKEPQDLYALTEEKIAAMPRGAGVVGTASKQIMKEIEKSKVCPLNEFMGSLGIKFLGRRQAEILTQGGMDTLEKFVTGTETDFAKALGSDTEVVPGDEPVVFGTKATELPLGIKKARKVIIALLKAGVKVVEPADQPKEEAPPSDGKLSGKSFCFTGAIEKVDEKGERYTRSRMQDLVRQNGGSVLEEVRGGLTYLVMADPNSTSSKTTKAKKLGVGLLGEADFFKMLEM